MTTKFHPPPQWGWDLSLSEMSMNQKRANATFSSSIFPWLPALMMWYIATKVTIGIVLSCLLG